MIEVDYREYESHVPEQLKKMNLPIVKANLEVCDYICHGSEAIVGVERKNAKDYLASITDGRRNNQLFQMSSNLDFSIMLIEGSPIDVIEHLQYYSERPLTRKAVYSSLVGNVLARSPRGLQGVISQCYSANYFDTALVIKYIHEHINDPKKMIRMYSPIKKLQYTNLDHCVAILACYPGIGEKRALDILKKFETPRNAYNASVKELITIKGIGKKIAQNFVKLNTQNFLDEERDFII
jgi:ERCC4-type nuclease